MARIIKLFLLIILISTTAFSQWTENGDTLIVNTLSYDSITTRSGTWQFPPAQDYEKILMHYSLKCDPRTTRDNFDCGEWDYLTYTVVTDSSGTFDSSMVTSPNYLVRGGTPVEYFYTSTPYQYQEQETIVSTDYGSGLSNKVELEVFPENLGSYTYDATESNLFRMLFSYDSFHVGNTIINTVDEIHAVKIKFLEDVKIKNFRIKLSTNPSISITRQLPFFYNNDIEATAGEVKEFVLNKPFELDPNRNLIFEVQGEIIEGVLSLETVDNSDNSRGMNIDYGAKKYLNFQTGDYIEVPSAAFDNIDDEITISFWQYGDVNKMPMNSYAFEGVNSNGQRVLNSHLPWSNSNIYWDAGRSGNNNDRLQKQALDVNFKGQWNHWAFTKNSTTGEMKIYLNGEEWASSTGNTADLGKVAKFKIASRANGYGNYEGKIDHFAVWNKVLSQSEVGDYMHRDQSATTENTFLEGLQVWYDMNSVENGVVSDISGNQHHGIAHGMPELRYHNSKDILTIGQADSASMPNLTLIKAEYDGDNDVIENEITVLRSYDVPMDELLLFDYNSPDGVIPADELASFQNQVLEPTDILFYYPANVPIYTYDEEGNIIDSTVAEAEGSYTRNLITWYSPIVDYEIHRFITPYGIGLDLGPDGFTWVEDVTDFAPILKDFVKLRAGNQQELIDITFYFIKGKPARDIVHMQTLWASGGSYASIVQNTNIEPKLFEMNSQASEFKAITRSSGHGFNGPANTDNCSEFCARMHSLWIDAEKIYEWEGWKECGDNPVFPQGGTWPIDRSDWCPGATVNTYEHELTGTVTPGSVHEVEYQIENPPQFEPYGNYRFTGYLFSYGEANFTNDVGIERIITPSNEREFERLNPVCGEPKIIIVNRGSEELTNLTIRYGLKGADNVQEFTWEGNLGYLQETEVTLPPMNLNNLAGDKKYDFEVVLSDPNGKADEYFKNNIGYTSFTTTPVYSKDVTLNIRTNNSANQQYSALLRDMSGNEIYRRDLGEFQSNQTYELDFELENGCYELLFENELGYGLDFWFLRDQLGSGRISITAVNTGKVFEPDFGNFIKYQFRVGDKPQLLADKEVVNFGFASQGETVERTLTVSPKNERGIIIEEFNISLGSLKGFFVTSPEIPEGGLSLAQGESQEITLEFRPKNDNSTTANLQIRTNSDIEPTKTIKLYGNTDITSVENTLDEKIKIELGNNPVNNELSFSVTDLSGKVLDISAELIDINGNTRLNLLESKLRGGNNSFSYDISNLEQGLYYIKITNDLYGQLLKKVMILR